MIHRRLLVVTVVLAGLALSACRRETPPPPPPPPAQDMGPDLDSLRAYNDSVAAAEAAARAAAAAEERARAVAAARAILEQTVYFDYDEAVIRPDTERALLQKVEVLRASPAVRIRLEGHTDDRGSVEYNVALGSRRAESIRSFFAQYGISGDRFQTTSFGEERPAVNRSDEAAWAMNRRVEFVITAGADQINPAN